MVKTIPFVTQNDTEHAQDDIRQEFSTGVHHSRLGISSLVKWIVFYRSSNERAMGILCQNGGLTAP